MLVSIITVSYNSEKTIKQTMESVLKQTYPNIEYIIVDGCSTDNTVEIVRSYSSKFIEKGYSFKVISEKDNGIYDAMNKGINLANGTIIGIINSDDWYESIAVETAVTCYQQTTYNVFYADINIIKNDEKTLVKHSKIGKIATSRHWNHPTTFVTKDTYNEIGTFRCEGLYDDFDFLLRARKSKMHIVVKNVVLANFRFGGVSNIKSFKECKRRLKDRYRCYRNNNYSRLYFIECLAIETAKMILS